MKFTTGRTAVSHLALGVLFWSAAASWSAAQETTSAVALVSLAPVSLTLLQTLPVIRSLGDATPVADVGLVPRRDGTVITIPMTAALAANDLLSYNWALLSLYPPSRDYYPADSIALAERQRAAAWVDRLLALRARHDPGVAGYQLVPFAQVAAQAGNDTLARQLFDARLAMLRAPSEQAYVLGEAIVTFSDITQDSLRLVRNLQVAEHYMDRLRTLVPAGFPANYRTQNDSTNVLYQNLFAEDTLMDSYNFIGAPASAIVHGDRVLSLAARALPDEREIILRNVGQRFAPAIIAQSPRRQDFSRRLDSLATRIVAVARSSPPAWRADVSPQAQARVRRIGEIANRVRGWMKELTAQVALIGTAVPAVPAHAWFNTPDSAYQHTPRARLLADGIVRVLLISDLRDGEHLPILNRVQQWFPRQAEGLLITETTGHIGPELSSPSDETAWLKSYYETTRHYTMPIALWAGDKQPMKVMMTSGTASSPVASPIDTTAYRDTFGSFIIVDGRGIVRAILDVRTRAEEAALKRRVAALIAETSAPARLQGGVQ